MSHNNKGYKPSKINAGQEGALKKILYNPENGFVGYIELQTWFNETYKTDIQYNTFRSFIIRKFKPKIKVARKYHAKKDQEAVDTFKKTSIKSAKRLSPIRPGRKYDRILKAKYKRGKHRTLTNYKRSV